MKLINMVTEDESLVITEVISRKYEESDAPVNKNPMNQDTPEKKVIIEIK